MTWVLFTIDPEAIKIIMKGIHSEIQEFRGKGLIY